MKSVQIGRANRAPNPSRAIVFGNVREPGSRVAQQKQSARGYRVLEDLNTRPAVTYLAKVLHPTEA